MKVVLGAKVNINSEWYAHGFVCLCDRRRAGGGEKATQRKERNRRREGDKERKKSKT